MLPYIIILIISIFTAFYSGFFVAVFALKNKDSSPIIPTDIKVPSIKFMPEKKAKAIDEEDEKKNEFFN